MDRTNVDVNVSGQFFDDNYYMFNVIDGNQDSHPQACNCCFATSNDSKHGWLKLDLRRKYLVEEIRIIGRSDGNF